MSVWTMVSTIWNLHRGETRLKPHTNHNATYHLNMLTDYGTSSPDFELVMNLKRTSRRDNTCMTRVWYSPWTQRRNVHIGWTYCLCTVPSTRKFTHSARDSNENRWTNASTHANSHGRTCPMHTHTEKHHDCVMTRGQVSTTKKRVDGWPLHVFVW